MGEYRLSYRAAMTRGGRYNDHGGHYSLFNLWEKAPVNFRDPDRGHVLTDPVEWPEVPCQAPGAE